MSQNVDIENEELPDNSSVPQEENDNDQTQNEDSSSSIEKLERYLKRVYKLSSHLHNKLCLDIACATCTNHHYYSDNYYKKELLEPSKPNIML